MNFTSVALPADDHNTLQVLLAALPDARAQISPPDCTTYQTYRPILKAALPFIQKIPDYGPKIATALSFLMQLADGVCNIPAGQVTLGGDTGKQSPGVLRIEKSGEHELRITLPQGSTINSNDISEKAYTPANRRNTAMKIRKDLDGLRMQLPGNDTLYLIDAGQKRQIPDPPTYYNLFRDSSNIVQNPDLNEIDTGAVISEGAVLAQASGDSAVYLIDGGFKRLIGSQATMDRYNLSWTAIQQVAPIIIASIPPGTTIVWPE